MKLIILTALISVLAACSPCAQAIPSPDVPASAPDAGALGAGGGGHR